MEISNDIITRLLKVGDIMKRTKIIFTFFIIILLLAFMFSIPVDASSITDPRENPGSYEPNQLSGADEVMDIGNRIIGIIQFIGSFASVIVLIVLGIKYMTGSIEEKAEYKKTMFPYLIGAILVFGLTNILAIVNAVVDGVL